MTQVFEHLGYSLEYYVDGRYIGSIKTDQEPTSFGYSSRQYYIAENSFQLTNAMGKVKTIKKGSKYYTEAVRLCGKVLGNHSRKVELFRNSKAWKNA